MYIRTTVGIFLFLCLLVTPVIFAADSPKTITIGFSQQDLRSQPQRLVDETYDLITMDELSAVSQPGHPCLPVRTVNIYVPQGSKIKRINIESVESRDLPGTYLLLPGQHEVPLMEGVTAEPVMPDEAIYALDQPYPASPIRLGGPGSVAGRKITGIQIFPAQYVPTQRKVIFNDVITFSVEFEDADTEPQVPRETARVRKLRNRIVAGMVENPGDLNMDFPENGGTLDPSAAVEYLLICIEAHADEYEVLKEWKTRKGIPAAIETIGDIEATYPGRDAPEQIRNCIMDYYLNQSTVWVVLTLSAPKARIRGCYCSVGDEIDTGIPCDLYFADMDGDWNSDGDSYWGETGDDVDLYPDVYVGRLPANKSLQCQSIVDKILTYEGYYSLPTDYQLEMLFLAEYADPSTDGGISKNMIDNESVPARYDPITKLYESSGNLNKTAAMNALNSGMGIINHDGHGNAQVLSIGPGALNTDDMMALTNAPRYSVFYTVACIPGNFENPMGCFAQGFLESPNGGGFFIGNSRYGWYWPGNPGYGTGELFDREFFESIFVRGFHHLGAAHADAKIQRIPWSGGNGTNRWTQFTCNLFGDPESHIWTDTPVVMSVSHPTDLAGSEDVTVTVYAEGSPLGDARVCLWMDPDIYFVDETDGAGEALFTVSPADTGSILVTVTKAGYLPYLGSMEVTEELSGIAGRGVGSDRLWIRVTPNPVIGSATIGFSLPRSWNLEETTETALRIYDAAGRLVGSLPVRGDAQTSGVITWDGRLGNGGPAPSGVYFVRLSRGGTAVVKKFVVLR
jgi:hypothetical protein